MTEARIDAIPVVDSLGQPVGVVSRADLVPEQGHGSPGRTAAELMTAPVRAVHADEPVAFVAQVLAKTGIRRLFVVNWDSRLVGVVARQDLLRVHPRDDAELSTRIVELLDDAEFAPLPV